MTTKKKVKPTNVESTSNLSQTTSLLGIRFESFKLIQTVKENEYWSKT